MTHEIKEEAVNDSPVLPGDPAKIIPKLQNLKAGEKVVYHVGNLMIDRQQHTTTDDAVVHNIRQIARRVMELYKDRKLHPTQRRFVSPNGFPYYEYIATGAKTYGMRVASKVSA